MLDRSDLQHADFTGANLRGASFRFALLTDCDFEGADLEGAILRNVYARNASFDAARFSGFGPQFDLRSCRFRGAFFRECDFAEGNFDLSDLTEARFIGCNFTRASLRRTRLASTSFQGCALQEAAFADSKLDGAEFVSCVFGATVLAGLDLSGVRFDGNQHLASSYILDSIGPTVRAEVSRDPESRLPSSTADFLVAAGVTPERLADLVSDAGRPLQTQPFFLSYSSADKAFAHRLVDDLHEAGLRVWMDVHEFQIGERIEDAISRGISSSGRVLLVVSEHSLRSSWIEKEVTKAVEAEGDAGRSILFPLRLDNAVLEQKDGHLGSLLRGRHIADFTRWQDDEAYRRSFSRLVRDLTIQASLDAEDAR